MSITILVWGVQILNIVLLLANQYNVSSHSISQANTAFICSECSVVSFISCEWLKLYATTFFFHIAQLAKLA